MSPDRKHISPADRISRRKFLQSSGSVLLGGGAALWAPQAIARSPYRRRVALPAPPSRRCVIVGGDISGLTVAKFLKKNAPDMQVILLEPDAFFRSSTLNSQWIAGHVKSDFLQYSYLAAARYNDYIHLPASAVDIRKRRKRLITDLGYIDYHYLVLAFPSVPDYRRFGIKDKDVVSRLRLAQTYPGLHQGGSASISQKNRLEDFEEGSFIINVPEGNYRNLSAPYELACLVAHNFQSEKVPGKVVLLDPNQAPKIMAPAFTKAFAGDLSTHLEYQPNVKIRSVDLASKKLETSAGQLSIGEAILRAPLRSDPFLSHVRLVQERQADRAAEVHPLYYRSHKSRAIFVIGDGRPQPFIKGGSTDYSEARYIADLIAADSRKERIDWRSPHTVEYAMINAKTRASVKFSTFYKPVVPSEGAAKTKGKKRKKRYEQAWTMFKQEAKNEPSADLGREALRWHKQLIGDILL